MRIAFKKHFLKLETVAYATYDNIDPVESLFACIVFCCDYSIEVPDP